MSTAGPCARDMGGAGEANGVVLPGRQTIGVSVVCLQEVRTCVRSGRVSGMLCRRALKMCLVRRQVVEICWLDGHALERCLLRRQGVGTCLLCDGMTGVPAVRR